MRLFSKNWLAPVMFYLCCGQAYASKVDYLIPVGTSYCGYVDDFSEKLNINDYVVHFQFLLHTWIFSEYLLGVSKNGKYYVIAYSKTNYNAESIELIPADPEAITSSAVLISKLLDSSYNWSHDGKFVEINSATDGADRIYVYQNDNCGYTFMNHNLGPNTQELINNYNSYRRQ